MMHTAIEIVMMTHLGTSFQPSPLRHTHIHTYKPTVVSLAHARALGARINEWRKAESIDVTGEFRAGRASSSRELSLIYDYDRRRVESRSARVLYYTTHTRHCRRASCAGAGASTSRVFYKLAVLATYHNFFSVDMANLNLSFWLLLLGWCWIYVVSAVHRL